MADTARTVSVRIVLVDDVFMPSRATRWIIGLVLLAFAMVMLLSYRIETDWQRMIATGAELEAGIDKLDTLRPVLHGEPIDGFAFDNYDRVIALLTSSSEADWLKCQKELASGGSSYEAMRDALVDDHEKMLESLSLGARSTDGRRQIQWDQGFERGTSNLLDLRGVANIVVLAADKHFDEGHPDLAIDVLLDGMQLGRDLMHAPIVISQMIGGAVLAVTSRGALIDRRLLDRIPEKELQRLALGMQRLEAGWSPSHVSIDGEIALAARSLAGPEFRSKNYSASFSQVLASWRYCFSTRWMCADYIQLSMRRRERLLAVEGQPWSERKKVIDQIKAEEASSPNPLSLGALVAVDETLLGIVCMFRFVRTAVQYRATGEMETLPDPFGGRLKVSEVGGKLRVESRGAARSSHRNQKLLEIDLVPPVSSKR